MIKDEKIWMDSLNWSWLKSRVWDDGLVWVDCAVVYFLMIHYATRRRVVINLPRSLDDTWYYWKRREMGWIGTTTVWEMDRRDGLYTRYKHDQIHILKLLGKNKKGEGLDLAPINTPPRITSNSSPSYPLVSWPSRSHILQVTNSIEWKGDSQQYRTSSFG